MEDKLRQRGPEVKKLIGKEISFLIKDDKGLNKGYGRRTGDEGIMGKLVGKQH